MAKKKTVKHTSSKNKMTWHFFVPSFVAGGIALIFSGSLMLGLEVLVVTALATWIIHKYA